MQTIPIGCDVSKDKIDLCVWLNDVKQEYLLIGNNQKGYLKALAEIKRLNIKPHICMEATGIYYEGFADFMAENGHLVSVVNPLKIKKFAESEFQKTKTDKQDARLIACYCLKMQPKADYVKPNSEQYAVRRNIALLKQLNADLNGIKNRIKVAKDEFVRQILSNQQKEIKKHIKEVRQHLAEITEQTSVGQVAEKLESIPAIGQTTALILAHYLNMYRFDSENKFVAFAGLAPGKHESGSSVRRSDKLTKYGNRTIKGALYMPAMVAYRFGYFGAFVNRLKNKGKPPKVILIAIMRKLAAIAWNLWKNGQTFDPARYGLNSKTA